MPRHLSIALIACLCLASIARADDKPSPAVKRILDKAVAEVRKNRQEFDKANQKPLGDARVELQELSTKMIKDGKTVDATAVLKQIESLEADVMRMAKAPAPTPDGGGGRPAPQKPLLERLAGRWSRVNFEIVIRPDGFVEQSNGDKGQLVQVSPDVASMQWSGGWKWQLRMVNEDMVAVLESDQGGNRTDGVVLTRIK